MSEKGRYTVEFIINSILPAIVMTIIAVIAVLAFEWILSAPSRWAHEKKREFLRAERKRMIEMAALAQRKRKLQTNAHVKRGKELKPFLRK